MTKTYSDDELASRVKTPGWRLTGAGSHPVTGTLQKLANLAHQKHKTGQAPGRIEEVETAIELDMIQIEKLWRYLGLPV